MEQPRAEKKKRVPQGPKKPKIPLRRSARLCKDAKREEETIQAADTQTDGVDSKPDLTSNEDQTETDPGLFATRAIEKIDDDGKTKLGADDSYKVPSDQTNATALWASRPAISVEKKEETGPIQRSGYGPCRHCGRVGKLEAKDELQDQEVQVFRVIIAQCEHHCIFKNTQNEGELCRYWTDFPRNLKRHLDKEHPYRCDIHALAFPSRAVTQTHLYVVHGIRRSGCAMCMTSYNTEQGYKLHCSTQGHRNREMLVNRVVGVMKKMDVVSRDLPFGAEDTRLNRDSGKLLAKVPDEVLDNTTDVTKVIKLHEIPFLKALRKHVQNERKRAKKIEKQKKEEAPPVVELAPTPPPSVEAEGPVEVESGTIVEKILGCMSPNSRQNMQQMLGGEEDEAMEWADFLDSFTPRSIESHHSGSESSAADFSELTANQELSVFLDQMINGEQQGESRQVVGLAPEGENIFDADIVFEDL